MAGIVIEPTTGAATAAVSIPQGESRSYSGWGFSGADSVTLQVLTNNGTYEDVVSIVTGLPVTLSSTGNSGIVDGPLVGRWNKGSTTGSVGVREIEVAA